MSMPVAAPGLARQDDAQDEGARDEKDRGDLLHAMAKASAQTRLLVKMRVVTMRALRPDEGPTDDPEEMDFGLAGRIVVVMGAGVLALAALNAGLMLRQRWLTLCGVAGMVVFLAMLIRRIVETIL